MLTNVLTTPVKEAFKSSVTVESQLARLTKFD